MAEVAKVIPLHQQGGGEHKLMPQLHDRVVGDSRAIAVAKFRELADKLERGEIDGARAQWLAPKDDQHTSELATVTRSARDHATGAGKVQLCVTTITERG
jgi:hypothetical protein